MICFLVFGISIGGQQSAFNDRQAAQSLLFSETLRLIGEFRRKGRGFHGAAQNLRPLLRPPAKYEINGRASG
jgi:hypothetical protein